MLYEVQPGDQAEDGTLRTQGVPYRDVADARIAAFEEQRAAAAAALDAALGTDSDNDDD